SALVTLSSTTTRSRTSASGIIGEAIRIHRRLGTRIFEAAYEEFLALALTQAGLSVKRQWVLPVTFDGHTVPVGYRLDLLVNERVVVEIKCSERAHDAHARQLLTYLRLGGYRTGLLINFGFDRLIDGVQRIVNGYEPVDGRERVAGSLEETRRHGDRRAR
ncbi:MAG: GxxExxY protein, partial [Gemmatimonadaceae bacterium]|nr:GxxExxY protein [Gemmatimonadaceae bacterium]